MSQDAAADESGRIYTAVKQAPSRCPRCLRDFDRVDTHWTVNPGASRPGVQGPFETAALFPEIWRTTTDQTGRVVSYAQELPGYEVQFISCRQCDNVTLSVEVDQRSFLTQEEAEVLCRAGGFTFVRESLINPRSLPKRWPTSGGPRPSAASGPRLRRGLRSWFPTLGIDQLANDEHARLVHPLLDDVVTRAGRLADQLVVAEVWQIRPGRGQ